MKKEFIGIDVSKEELDVWLYHGHNHLKVSNNKTGFVKMLKVLLSTTGLTASDLFVCFENTGLYSHNLCLFLSEKQVPFSMVSALRIKRSLGIVRGKSDKADARNIARFAWLHRDELKAYELPSASIIELKMLMNQRGKLIVQCAGHKTYIKEIKRLSKVSCMKTLLDSARQTIKVLNKQIAIIEQQMKELIKSDMQLSQTYQNITSIKGVGPVLATHMIVMTNNFKNFQNWRQFASFAGIAPFEHQSGTSYRGKTRVSKLGHRKVKVVLNQAAFSAVQYNPELKAYYHKRLDAGKSKMSTINIIRNKLVARVFAVATRQTPYVDIHKFAA